MGFRAGPSSSGEGGRDDVTIPVFAFRVFSTSRENISLKFLKSLYVSGSAIY